MLLAPEVVVKGLKHSLTQNQLIELFESDQVKALVERSEERGYIDPAELEAFTLEHDLNEDEVERFTRELETIGHEVKLPEAVAPYFPGVLADTLAVPGGGRAPAEASRATVELESGVVTLVLRRVP